VDEKIDEQTILSAARGWASRTERNEAIAVSNASETMAALKTRLPPEEFEVLLADLLHQYEDEGS
jgi:hypothetical protein